MPSHSRLQASLPSDRKPCFAVSIRGSEIAEQSPACSPTTGLTAGFVEAGQSMSLTLPRGEGRTVDLYMFLEDSGSSAACPNFSGTLSAAQLTSTYLVASQTGISTTADQTDVTLQVSFPGLAQNLATQLAMPSTCVPSISSSNSGNVRLGATSQTVTAGEMALTLKIGRMVPKQTQTAGPYKLVIH